MTGYTHFITFRTGDSMPKEVADAWHRRRDDWLRRHRIIPSAANWQAALRRLPELQQREFHATFSREYQESRGRPIPALAASNVAE